MTAAPELSAIDYTLELQAGSDWPEPIPLRPHGDSPAFPRDTLPHWLRDWVVAEARFTQTPSDMPAMLALAVLATCCARRMRVRVRDGWCEPLCLYTAIVLPPGTRKSAVMRAAREPLDACEYERALQLTSAIGRSQDAVAAAKRRHARAVERAARGEGPERLGAEQDLREARDELAAAERGLVRVPRLTCGDTSQEALARLLSEHDECLGLFDAEGCGPLAVMLGRYTDGVAAVDFYLRAHAGDAYRADRIGREPIVLHRPALTIAITAQPEVLRQLGERREMRGLGLLARILWCVPASTVGSRIARPQAMPEQTRSEYARRVRELLDLPMREDRELYELRISREADDLLAAMHERLEPQLGPGGELEWIADWAGKLCGAVARIAALLHAAEQSDAPWLREVSADTMERAIAIGQYLLEHGRAALGQMGADPVLTDAEHVLAWLRAHGVQRITRRDLYRALRSRFARPDDLEAPLTALSDRGWLLVVDAPAGGAAQRSVRQIVVSPRALDTRDRRDARDARQPAPVPFVPCVHAQDAEVVL